VSYDRDTWYKQFFGSVPGLTHVSGSLVVVSRHSDGMTLLAARAWRSKGYRVMALMGNTESAAIDEEGIVGYPLDAVSDALLERETRLVARSAGRRGKGYAAGAEGVDC